MMSGEFPSHGQFNIFVDGRVVVTEVEGPWNAELVHSWAKATRPYSLQMAGGGPWGSIGIIRGSMLCTPEAMDALRAIVSVGMKTFGAVAQAMVAAPDVAGRGVVEPVFQRLYEGVCAYRIFNEYGEAKQWMDAYLLEFSK